MRFPDRWWQERFDRQGDFEPETRRLAMDLVTRWGVAVDGGAHCGTWTRKLAQRFRTVVAFEPNPVNHAHLVANMKASNVVIHEIGLGDEHATFGMAPGPEKDPNRNSGQMHLVDGNSVIVAPLDAYELRDVGLVKLDVEGFEWHALKGAEQTIKRWHPVVIVEENGLCRRYGVEDGAAGRLLESWGYTKVGACYRDEIYAVR